MFCEIFMKSLSALYWFFIIFKLILYFSSFFPVADDIF